MHVGAEQGEARGERFPGRRITAEGAEKSQQCHKYFLPYSAFASERPQVRTWGAKLASWPGSYLTSLGTVQGVLEVAHHADFFENTHKT